MNWKSVRERLEAHADTSAVQAAYRERLLAERAATLALPLELSALPDPSGMPLTFSIGKSSYAVGLSDVAEVISQATPSPVPGAPAAVAGMIQLRGQMIPVYRLNELLGPDSVREPSGPVVILTSPGELRHIGLLCGEIGEILDTTPGDYRDPPDSSKLASKLVGERTLVLNVVALWSALGAKKEG